MSDRQQKPIINKSEGDMIVIRHLKMPIVRFGVMCCGLSSSPAELAGRKKAHKLDAIDHGGSLLYVQEWRVESKVGN